MSGPSCATHGKTNPAAWSRWTGRRLVECPLTREDMPNMGVNAFTVRNGELHQASAELLLPPASQMLETAVSVQAPVPAGRKGPCDRTGQGAG